MADVTRGGGASYADNRKQQSAGDESMGGTTLGSLPVGGTATVSALFAEGAMRRRLLDLGLIRGTRVRCLYRSLGGKMSAYLIRGAVIALRRGDADTIYIH